MTYHFWIMYAIAFAMGFVLSKLLTEIKVAILSNKVMKDATTAEIEFKTADDLLQSALFKALPESVQKEILEDIKNG